MTLHHITVHFAFQMVKVIATSAQNNPPVVITSQIVCTRHLSAFNTLQPPRQKNHQIQAQPLTPLSGNKTAIHHHSSNTQAMPRLHQIQGGIFYWGVNLVA